MYTVFHLHFTAYHAVILPQACAFCLKISRIVRNKWDEEIELCCRPWKKKKKLSSLNHVPWILGSGVAAHRAVVSCHVVRDGNDSLKCVLTCCGTASREYCRVQVHQGPAAMVLSRKYGPVSLPVLQTTSSQGCIWTVRKNHSDFCADAENAHTWANIVLFLKCIGTLWDSIWW